MEPQFLPCAAQVVGVQEPPVAMRRTGLLTSSLEAKTTPRLEVAGALIMNVAAPSVSCCTLAVTSYSIHVPALAAVMFTEETCVPADGALFQVIVVSPHESEPDANDRFAGTALVFSDPTDFT